MVIMILCLLVGIIDLVKRATTVMDVVVHNKIVVVVQIEFVIIWRS